MIRIEYLVPTASGGQSAKVIFADTFDEADSICDKCDELGYEIVDVSNFVDEA